MDPDRGTRDEIGHDDDRPRLVDRVPGEWRRPVALAVALCVGLALGGYGVRAWYEGQQRQEVRVRASLYVFSFSAGTTLQATMRLRNTGSRPVTIHRIRFDPAGFDTEWNNLDEPRVIQPHAVTDVAYELRVNCGQQAPKVAKARLRVGAAGDDPRLVTVGVPLVSPDLGAAPVRDVATAHTNMCLPKPVPNAEVELLDARRSANGDLVLRVRLTWSQPDRGSQPDGLRLTNMRSEGRGVSFAPAGGDRSVALPAEGELRVRTPDCDRIGLTPPAWVFFLEARFTTEQGSVEAGVSTDFEYAAALLDYLADRCGRD